MEKKTSMYIEYIIDKYTNFYAVSFMPTMVPSLGR